MSARERSVAGMARTEHRVAALRVLLCMSRLSCLVMSVLGYAMHPYSDVCCHRGPTTRLTRPRLRSATTGRHSLHQASSTSTAATSHDARHAETQLAIDGRPLEPHSQLGPLERRIPRPVSEHGGVRSHSTSSMHRPPRVCALEESTSENMMNALQMNHKPPRPPPPPSAPPRLVLVHLPHASCPFHHIDQRRSDHD